MIELAPANVNGLSLPSPVIVAPGCGEALRWADNTAVGAVATDVAVAATPRAGSTRWGATPAGVVFERLPSVRFDALVRSERRRWARSPLPVLLALRGAADEMIAMVERLETVEGVAGRVLLVRDPAVDEVVALLRGMTTLPLLPVLGHSSQLTEVAAATVAAVEGGAAPDDIDRAMRLGVNHPRGPFEWAAELGAASVVALLDRLAELSGDARYRVAESLRAAAGGE